MSRDETACCVPLHILHEGYSVYLNEPMSVAYYCMLHVGQAVVSGVVCYEVDCALDKLQHVEQGAACCSAQITQEWFAKTGVCYNRLARHNMGQLHVTRILWVTILTAAGADGTPPGSINIILVSRIPRVPGLCKCAGFVIVRRAACSQHSQR